jgi:hypothetical protein
VAGWPVPIQHRQRIAQSTQSGEKSQLRRLHRARTGSVIVEGVAELADLATRRKLLAKYGKKYDWDMSTMAEDILSMKEPVFAVRPRVVFAMWEKYFQTKSTRWTFE